MTQYVQACKDNDEAEQKRLMEKGTEHGKKARSIILPFFDKMLKLGYTERELTK